MPSSFVSSDDAARFVSRLENGHGGARTTETGSRAHHRRWQDPEKLRHAPLPCRKETHLQPPDTPPFGPAQRRQRASPIAAAPLLQDWPIGGNENRPACGEYDRQVLRISHF
jgi:hypothetical protein